MTLDRDLRYREMAARCKYKNLYEHLSRFAADQWRTSFGEVESILGFDLPPSARLHRPWWANHRGVNGHSQALAWGVAGWETSDVDMDAETLLFRRTRTAKPHPKRRLDEIWPVHQAGAWPGGLGLSRASIYEDRI